jgi:hypothetical protein
MDQSQRYSLLVGALLLIGSASVFVAFSGATDTAVVVLAGEPPAAASKSDAAVVEPSTRETEPRAGFGTLTGQIVLDGNPPILPPLVSKYAERKDPECCRGEIPDEHLVVDPKTSGIRNVFVYLAKAPVIHSDLRKSTQLEVEVRSENCRYVPHALIARTDQTVMFKVLDKCGHSAHAYPLRSASHCAAISLGSPEVPLSYKVAEREPFLVMCDVHPWMRGYWLILDHPYSAITDAAGNFRIEKLPAGDHQFVVWHEAAKTIDRKLSVTIKADETTVQRTLHVPIDKFKL